MNATSNRTRSLTVSRLPAGRRAAATLAVLTMAVSGVTALKAEPAPEVSIAKSVMLSWPQATAEEFIPVGANTIGGAWSPVLEPIFKRNGGFGVAVPIIHMGQWLQPSEYFKLVPGHQYANDFSSETGEGWEWNNLVAIPGLVTHSFSNGVLRVQDDTLKAFLFPCPEPDVIYQDFAMSVDILDWNDADQGVGLYARTAMPSGSFPGTTYSVVLTTKNSSLGGPGLYIWAAFADGTTPNLAGGLVPLDPAKAYRLVFAGTGPNLKAELYELPSLQKVKTVEAINSAHTQGIAGLYFVDYRDISENIDITVDNLVITGTTP